ncbi:MAG: hypothetical protein RLZZ127_2731, partial [Planctomycetota bacterium]
QRLPAARQPTDPAPAAYALRHHLAALVAGTPDREAPPRILAARVLAEGLVTRPAAPDRTDLAQAAEVAPLLAGALADPEAAASPQGHLIADTLACIRFRQGRAAEAATLWERAIALAGAGAPPLYQRRLAAARRGDAPGDLPR